MVWGMVYATIPSTWKVEAGGLKVRGHLWLHSTFEIIFKKM